MVTKEVDLVCVQETKLGSQYAKDCEDFEVVAESPVGKVGGLQVLIRKNRGLKVQWSRAYSFRVLAVGFAWQKEDWCVINAYAPTTAATPEEFTEFWQQVLLALEQAKKNGLPVIIGADLNTRLGGERDDERIGPAVYGLATSEQRYRATMLADSLLRHDLVVWSTMIGDPYTTWRSPHETPSQIDYILGDRKMLGRLLHVLVQDLECFASDHSMVICILATSEQKVKKTRGVRPKAARIRSPDHSLAVKLALAQADHSAWDTLDDPLAAISGCIKAVKRITKHAPGSKATVKKEWITTPTWEYIRAGATLRRGMNKAWSAYSRCRLALAWEHLRSWTRPKLASVEDERRRYEALFEESSQAHLSHYQVPDSLLRVDTRQRKSNLSSLLWVLFRIACRKQAKKVQKAVKADKNAWLQEHTDELQIQCEEGNSSTIHKQVKRCLVRLRPNIEATRRAPLRDDSGKVYTTLDEKQTLWQTHWAYLYGGVVSSQVKGFKTCRLEPSFTDAPRRIEDSDWFTHQEVRAALRHQMNGKASIDGVPSRELVVILEKMTPIWQRAFNHFLEVGAIPEEYK
eukprot:1157450-Amphidinium_carterae.1